MLSLLIIYPGVTYVQALTAPGAATFAARTADWARQMGAGPVVNAVENWYYTRHPPANSAPNANAVPVPVGSTAPAGDLANAPAPLLTLPGGLHGEGAWAPGARTAGGQPADYTTFLRPDPAHTSVVAAVVAFDQKWTGLHLIAGTKEPGGHWPEGAQVPDALRPSLLATFNSGFKFRDTPGGFYADGQAGIPLKNGMASLVIDKSGVADVALWGRDARLTPDVAAVRQNLELVVDGGRPVPGLSGNPAGQWGSAKNQFQFTWRSGVGVDAQGRLIYVAGDQLTLTALASALSTAGAVRGMELDIHGGMVSANLFRPDIAGSSPKTLTPDMPTAPDRYLSADQRDFFAVTARAGALHAPTAAGG
ncbi:phosphodiester glycosidase family protein [Amycolatopsis sp. NPDC051758]|uniref:phosphodiester glycosidase family protein n=1 Tax=Amycolatopsis sp. NPDC051758 TaxID=3363935 RepID=UPI0037B4917B